MNYLRPDVNFFNAPNWKAAKNLEKIIYDKAMFDGNILQPWLEKMGAALNAY